MWKTLMSKKNNNAVPGDPRTCNGYKYLVNELLNDNPPEVAGSILTTSKNDKDCLL